ncbi:MAG: lysophospholipid acyltransferase family protein [Flammeovirgaceae bacterium]
MISEIMLRGLLQGKNIERAIHLRRKLAARLVRFLNVNCELSGVIPQKGTLGITNHRSYIDSICIFQYLDACPVVKAEVKQWPVVGFGLIHSGTVFVDRKSRESRKKTREQIADFVNQGVSTIVFVEGTTYVGPEAGEFRPGTFMIAAEGGLEVVPIAIEFEHQDAAWIGTDKFLPHFLTFFGKYHEIKVKVAFGNPIRNDDWEQLRRDCHTWVNNKLLQMRAEFDRELAANH